MTSGDRVDAASQPVDLDKAREIARVVLDRDWHPGTLDAAGHMLIAMADELCATRDALATAKRDALLEAADASLTDPWCQWRINYNDHTDGSGHMHYPVAEWLRARAAGGVS